MTGSTMRSSTPPPELISSIARSVALSCDCSMAEVTPVWEKSTPTRHGPSVSSLKPMTLTYTIVLVRSERPYVRLKETQIRRLKSHCPRKASSLPHSAFYRRWHRQLSRSGQAERCQHAH